MQCPECQFDNRVGAKFCSECGLKFEFFCPECDAHIRASSKFCDECGCTLESSPVPIDDVSEIESPTLKSAVEIKAEDVAPIAGERKHVTVLFSDLTGYTAMSELLDPEDAKDITTQIFDKISKIVNKYDGFIEKFAGDAVMALFGAKEAHEDDPVRAIKAAIEIHNAVKTLSPKYEKIIKQPLSMHTGINTGLVVTGDLNLEKGTHGVAGDTINVASRLSSLGNADDIIVGQSTFRQAEGHFDFRELEPASIKGKSASIQIFKVLKAKDKPAKIRRLHGLRADLIGRKVEINKLAEAIQILKRDKKGLLISISGSAGTGKSRLLEEFRSGLDSEEIQWLEGHAYPYAQNIPYYPLIDLLNKALQIKEDDPPMIVKEKVETGVSNLLGEETNLIPYIGSLFSISYPEIDQVSPDFWKAELQKAVQTTFASLSQEAPMIICLEDLHWADPSFLGLIRLILAELRDPILFLCTYRPVISLFTSHQISNMVVRYDEIRLQDLSPTESQLMVESLLNTESIPTDLQRFVQEKIEGNPFYIEEVINSLIELGALIRDNGKWKVIRPISETDISSTIHGVISSRLDRLENKSKRILQKASVIGRSFLYEILKRITDLESQIDKCLSGLERLDFIKTRAVHPDLEYIFKHALTQDVVYSGLLKSKRQEIHERIGLVMEQLFQDRLPEFYEILAFHFKQSQSLNKAVDYLIKAGEKSLRRYAVEESHQFFKEAFDILSNKPDKTGCEEGLIIDTLLKWAFVFNHRGEFGGLTDLFSAHEDLANSLNDKKCLGMFYAWLGWGLLCREKLKDAYEYLSKALKLGEEAENHEVVGYACCWLSWVCADLGLLDEAIVLAKRVQNIKVLYKSDKELFRFSTVGIGLTYWFRGECKKTVETGKILLEYGQRESDLRCVTTGHMTQGSGYYAAGNLPLAIECYKRAIHIATDPIFAFGPKLLLGMTYVTNGQLQEAEDMLGEVMEFNETFGAEFIGTAGQLFQGIITIMRGNLSQGVKTVENLLGAWLENGSRYRYVTGKYILGKLYLQILQGAGPKSFSFLVKNIGFLVKNVPFADKKAEAHFNEAIEVAEEIGAKVILGQAKLDLGMLHKVKGRTDQAQEYISSAIKIFEECEAEIYLKQAKEVIA